MEYQFLICLFSFFFEIVRNFSILENKSNQMSKSLNRDYEKSSQNDLWKVWIPSWLMSQGKRKAWLRSLNWKLQRKRKTPDKTRPPVKQSGMGDGLFDKTECVLRKIWILKFEKSRQDRIRQWTRIGLSKKEQSQIWIWQKGRKAGKKKEKRAGCSWSVWLNSE